MRKIIKRSFWLALLTVLLLYGWLLVRYDFSKEKVNWGVTFSYIYAKELGLDWKQVYQDILYDLNVKHLRIPVYWSEVEQKSGEFDFTNIDWQVIEAGRAGAEVILVVGYRVPRWPECHIPDWAEELSINEFDKESRDLVRETVEHFKIYDNIKVWQVNNEPFLRSFGKCREMTSEELARQIKIVRETDNENRPVMVTESGELSTWIKGAKLGDVIGTSLYRTVWNEIVGYWRYPIPPVFYKWHADIIKKFFNVEEVIISELQAEPWPPGKHILLTTFAEQFKSFDLAKLEHNMKYAKRTGINDIYLWGAEWWYWLKGEGYPEYWDFVRDEMNKK